ncbi:MAG: signal peptidase II [Candidatus Brocadiaceae bacterium]|nr:signal peptidase II [Candidatus Brocadiaceae bacterium]
MKNTAKFVITIVLGVISDIVSKWFVFSHLDVYEKVTLIPGVVDIIRNENKGVVFGLFPGKTTVFTIVSFLAIFAIVYIYICSDKSFFLSNVALGLIMAGAIGNLWDRLWYRHVRDFIDLHIGNKYHWPTFNIADGLICVGISCMVFTSFFAAKQKESNEHPLL